MKRFVAIAAIMLAPLAVGAAGDSLNGYVQTNLVSDLPGVAAHQDADLVNPWGIVAGPSTPFWINDNGIGLSTLYNGAGTKLGLIVTVPPPANSSGPSAPTGIVFNSGSSFGGAHFIFDTEDGTLSAWNSGSSAALKATSSMGSVYKGLTIGNNGSADLLYAANFGLGRVDVFDSNFHSATVSGGFQDQSLPAGYAPFDIQNIGGKLYVTYALQDAAKQGNVAGPGNGFVDVFDLNGNLVQRLMSQGALNSPWGLALAPSGFGEFSGDLLVGNFGDGMINAYDPSTGGFLGTIDTPEGMPVVIDGLWGLSFGNGAQGQALDALYFTAGVAGPDQIEDHGLFGSLSTATPEPQSLALAGLGLAACLVAFPRRLALFAK
ncbi:MAG: TIGR03118 family protein [Bryobacteraceae bacterium]